MEITRDQFERECKRRYGVSNPERMRVATWEWMVRQGGGPYPVRMELGLEPNYGSCTEELCRPNANPDWCFSRFGMSRTTIPDGRIICVAGEHEDWYDPDFCIYNDVVVLRPDPGATAVTLQSGGVEIYGYPESVFPPTDYHSATLIGEGLILIGRLGYPGTRLQAVTPVVALDTRSYRIEQVATTGPCPGWIYRHYASYDPSRHAIAVRGGRIEVAGAQEETPHLSVHWLYLDGFRWELINRRETHRRFIFSCSDDSNDAFCGPTADSFRVKTVPCDWFPPEDHGVDTYYVDVQHVRVSFEDFLTEVRALVEGDLPLDVTDQIMAEVTSNLCDTTGSPWTVQEVHQ